LILSSLCLALLLLDPLRDLPQPLDREQRWLKGAENWIGRTAVVRQTRGDCPVKTVGHADDEVGIGSSADSDELDSLTVQRMVRMSHCYPFLRWLAKGGSVL